MRFFRFHGAKFVVENRDETPEGVEFLAIDPGAPGVGIHGEEGDRRQAAEGAVLPVMPQGRPAFVVKLFVQLEILPQLD